ncbi:exopolyphosphatase [Roseibium sediminis]|uniref:exopolyphosphatase n=1 Tax=Roseibium sediminis TaxID=1775174 RepID=UPI001FCAD0C7|nr:exopolyphosphatase [Roseibium sediminis]
MNLHGQAVPTTLQSLFELKPVDGYRLITRSDMDGLVCAVLLKELNLVGEITFAHPKDMQDGIIEVGLGDITTNLPYVPGVGFAFDHHDSETKRIGKFYDNHIIDSTAPSAARVVYDYFGGKARFPKVTDDMMHAVDKADAAQFTREDVLNPQGWELLSFLMDARTGLGRFRDFRISNYQLMMQLIDFCREEPNIDNLLELPDVKERVDLFMSHKELFEDQIRRCTTVHGPLAVLDLRDEDPIYSGNRFMIYALYPETNISCHALWGKAKQNTVFAFGKSIFDRSNPTHIGELMLKYGGGGHTAAGTCQIDTPKAEETLAELIEKVKADSA